MKFLHFLLVAIALFSIASKPTQQSFTDEIVYGHDRSKFSRFVLQVADFLGVDQGVRIEYADFLFFSSVRLHQQDVFGQTVEDGLFLGVWGKWIPLNRAHVVGDVECRVPCVHGICLGDQCVCLPSWSGSSCQTPIRGFISLWERVSVILPKLIQDFYYHAGPCVLGIPLNHIPVPWIHDLAYQCHLVNLSHSVSSLDGVFILMISIFLMWKCMADQEWMETHFTCSWFTTVDQHYGYTLWTSALSHRALPHFIHNLYTLYMYGPVVYSLLGDTVFVVCWVVVSGLTSGIRLLAQRHASRPDARWIPWMGASGSMVGLRCVYLLLLYRYDLTYELVSDHLVGYMLLDGLLSPHGFDIKGYMGGAVSAWVFMMLRKRFYYSS